MNVDEIVELVTSEPWLGLEIEFAHGGVVSVENREDVIVASDQITVLKDSKPWHWIATEHVRDVRPKSVQHDAYGLFDAVQKCDQKRDLRLET